MNEKTIVEDEKRDDEWWEFKKYQELSGAVKETGSPLEVRVP